MHNRLTFIIVITACKAQQTYPMSQSAVDMPTDSYFKDINNELDVYVGSWKTDFNGKIITLIITKEIKKPFALLGKKYFTDQLIVRYEVKNNNGTILQSSTNKNFVDDGVKYMIKSGGINIYGNNEVNLVYAGGNCSVGNGEIKFQKISATQLSWSYYPGTAVMNDLDCPPGQDYHIYLPETENLLFTKQ